MNDIRITTDGGTRGSNPGSIYIAYSISIASTDASGKTSKWIIPPKIKELNIVGDNNLAEYLAVLFALSEVVHIVKNTDQYSISIVTDSQNMMLQLRGESAIRKQNIKNIHAEVLQKTQQFRLFYIRWVPRKKIVRNLGC